MEKVSTKTLRKPKLYAWGNNSYGQLALNTGNIVVHTPTEVLIPEIDQDDQLFHIECGWKSSAILTKKGNVWITEVPTKKVAKEDEESIKSNHSKKKKKDSVEVSKGKEVEKSFSKWVDITNTCTRLR